MYVRFVSRSERKERGVPVGPFYAAQCVKRDAATCQWDREILIETLAWFGDELRVPAQLEKSTRFGEKYGYCWFRDTAREHIARMRVFAWLLPYYGYPVEMIWNDHPGHIIWEDEIQVVAVPNRDSFVG